MSPLQQNIHAIIRPGDEKGYFAECMEISVVTQGMTLDEVSKNLVEAVSLHLYPLSSSCGALAFKTWCDRHFQFLSYPRITTTNRSADVVVRSVVVRSAIGGNPDR